MDRYVTATEANQRFSEILRDVQQGETVTVTSRGRPVAEFGPPKAKRRGEDIESLIDLLRKRPLRVSGPWTREDLYE